MNTTDLVHYVSTGERPRPMTGRPAPAVPYHQLVTPVRVGILRARQFLWSEQLPDGSWLGQIAGDASLASQWVLLLAYRGQEHCELAEQAARAILDAQLPGGGWSRAPGGDADVSVSVQAYFALKLAGHDPSNDRLSKARRVIRSLGGADAADAVTRFYLALLGQLAYDCCPVVVPELLLFHHRQRRELAPLSVLWSHRPVRDIGLACGVRELFVNKPGDWPVALLPKLPADIGRPAAPWRRSAASMFTHCERLGWTPLRRRALDVAEAILLERTTPGSLAQLNYDEIALTIIALDTLGHGPGTKPFDACEDRLQELIVCEDRADRAGPQFRTMPISDTALALRAVRASGIPLRQLAGPSATTWLAGPPRFDGPLETMEMAWLLELLQASGDEANELVDALPPDIQISSDSSTNLGAARSAALRRRAGRVADRYVAQLLKRQNRDGGWGPTLDRSSSAPDVTGAVLEALSEPGRPRPRLPEPLNRGAARAVAYLRAAQRADGSWTSAAGAQLVQGTSQAICGLLAAGVSPEDDAVAAGVNWLVVHQQPIGGWGESPSVHPDGSAADYAVGRVTATQTAWALMALVAAGVTGEEPARRAVQFLLDIQEDDGAWRETHFTLHDFETGRWFRNDVHTVAWPLLALSRWAVAAASDREAADQFSLRLVGVADGAAECVTP